MIKAHAWASTLFGPLDEWPAYLRFAVNFIIGSQTPMAIVWGQTVNYCTTTPTARFYKIDILVHWGLPASDLSRTVGIYTTADRAGVSRRVGCFGRNRVSIGSAGRHQDVVFHGTYNPLRDEDGNVHGFLAIVVDTTKRVTREQARARVFDTILSSTPILLTVLITRADLFT